MRISLTARRFIFGFMGTMTVFALMAGLYQVDSAARAAMSENAVPAFDISGNGVVEALFDGVGLSCLRSVIGKVFPYAALVVELLLCVFFGIIGAGT